MTFKKNIFRVDIQLYQHEWKLEKREIVWKHDARRAECVSLKQGSIVFTPPAVGEAES